MPLPRFLMLAQFSPSLPSPPPEAGSLPLAGLPLAVLAKDDLEPLISCFTRLVLVLEGCHHTQLNVVVGI